MPKTDDQLIAGMVPPKGSRNLVVLCDGTGNELGRALAEDQRDIRISNVLKVFRIAEKRTNQHVWYSPGVGTIGRSDWLHRIRQKVVGFVGLAAGYGLDDNVLAAYRFLVETWRPGDRIFLVGFSRGAWTVRVLAGMLHLIGLVRLDQMNMCDSALETYKRAAAEDKLPLAWHFARVINARYPTIHFLGCWDTVASVIVPRPDRFWLPSFEDLPFTKTNPSVATFRHALALDERRALFQPAEWIQPQAFVPNRFRPDETRTQDIEQRWFPGVHSDVGGGYPESESGLSKLALVWLLDECGKAGMKLNKPNYRHLVLGAPKEGSGHQYRSPDPAATMHRSLKRAWWLVEAVPKRVRKSMWPRPSLFGLYLPLAQPRWVDAEHSLDPSIAARMDRVPSYRPVNLPAALQALPALPRSDPPVDRG
ncbi:DUF2235 domain-containing protein [Aquamicrobium segne]|uniref:DUF2235 domain-containing protein n=1 Tax=Aquamicrobium segne TaxID=469547 RepID=A0ABW0GT90_9HYPH